MSSAGMSNSVYESDYRKYPELFTWNDLKDIIKQGNLSLLRRHPDHQQAYDDWRALVVKEYGSIPHFLLTQRLGWTDFPGKTDVETPATHHTPQTQRYFTASDTDNHKLLCNDWGYAIPHNDKESVEHWVCWSKLPLIHRDLFTSSDNYDAAIRNGVYGFTGVNTQPPDGASEIYALIEDRFKDSVETAFFINPPHLQSVKQVEHFHIFVRN